jgi:hypothetical protein
MTGYAPGRSPDQLANAAIDKLKGMGTAKPGANFAAAKNAFLKNYNERVKAGAESEEAEKMAYYGIMSNILPPKPLVRSRKNRKNSRKSRKNNRRH